MNTLWRYTRCTFTFTFTGRSSTYSQRLSPISTTSQICSSPFPPGTRNDNSTSTSIFYRNMSSLPGTVPLTPQSFPTSGFETIHASEPVEEELLPGYKAEMYYPVHIGEVFNDRYQVVGKLGYGVTSTVWLARDLMEPNDPGYVAIKIYISGPTRSNEVTVYQHINTVSARTKHLGKQAIRKLFSSFQVQGLQGKKHTCIVHEALGITMDHLLDYLPNRSLRVEDVRLFLRQLLLGLDFLHTKAGIIHTDIQLKNLLLPVGSPFFFQEFEEGECEDPSSRKILKDRTIYCTRYMSQALQGCPLICDFGEARFADGQYDDDIMPDVYRAPEVIMQMNWNFKVDIWSVAMVAWDFVAPRTLFHRQNPENNEPDDRYLLAELGAMLGPPPPEYIRQNRICQIFWDENGKWKNIVPMPDITLEKLAEDIEGEDKDGFLRFLRRILRWDPEERPTAEELIFDPWLMAGLGLTEEQTKEIRERDQESEEKETRSEES